jgi:hypothetical protein
MMRNTRGLFNLWVVLGALGITLLLCLISYFGMGMRRSGQDGQTGFQPADLTVIPGPTSTPDVQPTATLDPLLVGTPTPEAGVIAIGGYVQISGTEGEGLRMRSAPGLDSELLFLGYDAEVFEVRDGPQEVDGYTWWYLVAPYDENRAGWAASDYLSVVPGPQ